MSDEFLNRKTDLNKNDEVNFINTNARSLCPKIHSLIDSFEELQLTFGTITETWLADGEGLEEDLQDLALGAGLGMICRNREPGRNGVAHGGVALVYRNNISDFKKICVPNPGNFEILPCIGTIRGHSRKMVVVSCYLPPNYPTRRGKEALEYITNVIVQIKRKYTDPYLVVTGDFNQWEVDDSLADLSLIHI